MKLRLGDWFYTRLFLWRRKCTHSQIRLSMIIITILINNNSAASVTRYPKSLTSQIFLQWLDCKSICKVRCVSGNTGRLIAQSTSECIFAFIKISEYSIRDTRSYSPTMTLRVREAEVPPDGEQVQLAESVGRASCRWSTLTPAAPVTTCIRPPLMSYSTSRSPLYHRMYPEPTPEACKHCTS